MTLNVTLTIVRSEPRTLPVQKTLSVTLPVT